MNRVIQGWIFSMVMLGVSSLSLAAQPQSSAGDVIQDQVFYFVIPDRFANGDNTNDTGGINGGKYQHGFDATDSRFYHGGDLAGLTAKLPYLKTLGVTAVWISPPFVNKPVQGQSAGYHGYWATDYTQVDPHWGSNDDLHTFVSRAHAYKMKVFLDVVINHTADVIKFSECHDASGALLEGLSSCPYKTVAEAQTTPYTPFIPAGEEAVKSPAWLNDPAYYHNQGDSTFDGESSLNGDFFGLDDLDTANPTVIAGMIDIFKGWITDFGIDGFRVDTIKHVDVGLWQQWVPAIQAHAEAQGINDFFIFGEVFDGAPARLSTFTREATFPSVLDFGLYYAFKDVVSDYQGTDRLAWVFSQDDGYLDADTQANHLMNFVSNHDVGRIGHFIDQMPISEVEKLARAKLAQTLMFFSRGVPVIYYGDEQGFTGDGGDAEAREDMMPSSVASYNDNDLLGTEATTADDNFDRRHPLYNHLRNLARIKKQVKALRRGTQIVRYSQSTPGLFVTSRILPGEAREAVIAINTSTDPQSLTLPALSSHYNQVWPSMARNQPAIKGAEMELEVPGLSARVYLSNQVLALPQNLPTVSFANVSEGDLVNGLVDVQAQLSGGDDSPVPLYRVHFSMQVGDGPLQPLGTDLTADYRVFADVSMLPDDSQITFYATVDGYGQASNSAQVTVTKGLVKGMTVYFKKPSDWGDEVNIYWFGSAPQADVQWPGVAMTPVIDDWYQFTFDDGVGQANLIFNDGSQQTADLFRQGDGCYVEQAWQDSCDIPEPGMTVYFQAPADWGSDVNVYWFNTPGQSATDWPGQPMTLIGERWYRFQFDNDVNAANLIFNDGSQQTTDLYREGDGCYVEQAWLSDCTPPVAGIKVLFKRPATWAETLYIHYWNSEPVAGTNWPGIEMTDEGNDWYSYQFPLNGDSANLLFHDGQGNQTGDLYRTQNGCYVGGNWQDSCVTDVLPQGMTVYFRRPLDWNVPNVHYWYDGGASTWPGEEMSALGNDWYAFQLPDGVTATNLVINDKTDGSNGHQTGDLYREGDGCYDLDSNSWADSCPIPGYTVYFKKPAAWSNAHAYYWSTSPYDVASVGWPGEAMTALGDDWFSYQLPDGVQASNIIFNNAGQPQTADLSRSGDGCYTLEGGWTDTCEAPQPGMTVYFYKPDHWGSALNVYFFNAPDAPSWPGLPMVSLGEGWYSYTFAQGVTAANLIFNDGQGNQTADLYRENGGCYGEFGDRWRQSCLVPSDSGVEIVNQAAHWLSGETLAWQVADSRASQYRLYYAMNATLDVEAGAMVGEDGYVSLTNSGSLSVALQERYPHLAGWASFQLSDTTQNGTLAQAQLVAAAFDSSGNLLEATRVQRAGALDTLFAYDGNLGVQYAEGVPSVTLWAPTAQSVELVRYDSDGNELARHSADAVSQGAYTFNGSADWDRQYYRFALTVYHPVSNSIEFYEVTDPYSVTLSANSSFSQFVDMTSSDSTLAPTDWWSINKALPSAQDITLYEGHVRDFSQHDTSVPVADRGKYTAFTHNGENGAALSLGMAHLKRLQQAGLSHFHLLPVFDISSVDENPDHRVDIADPFSRLCSLSTDDVVQSRCDTYGETPIVDVLQALRDTDAGTEDIQALVGAMVNLDSFNWGYDPFHFNAPEGSYATSPDGITRILEFRQMVKALDEIGLKVVMDVVYNHTSASGLWSNSVLDKTVPGYYHRLNPISGAVENSTCCDNTATEHRMMEKLMVDTLVHWARYYKIDAFRFDLMGHIPKSAMLAAQAALAELTLAEDGVDGANVYLYGEGWDFGEVAGNQRFEQATQFNMAGTDIGTFNDRLRSAVRGGNFTDSGRAQGWTSGNELFSNGYVSGGGVNDQADRIRIGLAGNLQTYPFIDHSGNANTGVSYGGVGYTLDPQESVNYVDKHDNETLWDNTQAKLPDSMSMDDRVRVHMLSTALINYGQGVPFYQMGTDLLRSKSLDRNSYNSGDWFNRVDFSAQDNQWAAGLPLAQDNQVRWQTMSDIIANGNIVVTPAHQQRAHDLFIEQLKVRYSSPLFRLSDADYVHTRLAFHNTGAAQTPGLIAMTLSDGQCSGVDLDPQVDGLLVLFNADDQALQITVPGTAGSSLHPLLAVSSDSAQQGVLIDHETYTVPAHTATVLVKPQGALQGDYPCNPQAGTSNQPGMVVNVKKPADWSTVNLYYWNTSPVEASVGWPGAPMAALGDDWYQLQLPNGVDQSNLIFNDGQGQQTTDLYRQGDGCYDIGLASWSDSCSLPGLRVYFQKPADWSNDIHIHYWNAGSVAGTAWPGEVMTALAGGWFFFQMPDGVRSANLIFNDANTGSGGQTADLSRQRDGCYVFASQTWSDTCEVASP
ncbi:pullulanase-type alpha-1,6-glucosidase [Aestuariibacter halophilus]|uniref:Pullulanase-type alpha-1,6-glucosidase n=1 Tax=Fluctibacter halophilus TaxID=226011 RepID=A0ABS8GD43_9ALTE|nr:pullulanase-type alpha-1,6-glucosidase [Aestuariibacter halophilus]MCC2617790.1 pullulanase-type alpha-1,6-glucosidase [Aestuariibacter halophilus]